MLSVSVSLFVVSGRPVPGWSHHSNVLKQSPPSEDFLNHAPLMKVICKGYLPRNADKATNWALKSVSITERAVGEQQDGIWPVDLLESNHVKLLIFWLSHFVVKARCKDGNSYPPATIHNMLFGLYCCSKSNVPCGGVAPNFMCSPDPAFRAVSINLHMLWNDLQVQI